jgi:hypothetical protein
MAKKVIQREPARQDSSSQIFVMERLHVDGRLRASVAAAGAGYGGCPYLELRLPRCDRNFRRDDAAFNG